MKVLFVNTSDHAGGAAIAALRLMSALRGAGIDVSMLCRDQTIAQPAPGVHYLKVPAWRRLKFLLERLEIFVRNGFTRRGLFAVDTARLGNDITHHPLFHQADIIHLHWTNQAMLSLSDVRRILRSGKRVVVTMHDMWTFTGVCHNADSCQRWLTGCGKCPQLMRPSTNDLSATTFRRKQKAYAAGCMTLVGCSQWMAEMASRAPLLKGQRVVSIPNPIDTHFYAPAATEGQPTQAEVREKLGLPPYKKLIFFTAYKVTDPYKGIDHLRQALQLLRERDAEWAKGVAVVTAGKGGEGLTEAFGSTEVYNMGLVSDPRRMRQLYQACDILAMPTLRDNLPNTIVEAMACALPCVAYNVGGVPQMIDTGVNGYLAPLGSIESFAQGIYAVLRSPSFAALQRNARTKAVTSYSQEAVAREYLKIYKVLGDDASLRRDDTHNPF